jgi:ribonuclease Z
MANDKQNWTNSVQLIPNVLSITGVSWAARKTGLYCPELRIMHDCGNPSQFSPEVILGTHGHIDHTAEIAKTLIDTGSVHPKIFFPTEIKERIRSVIHSFFVLTKNTETPKVHNKYTLTGVVPGDKVPLRFDKKDKKRVALYAEVIKCYHTVPCVGYGMVEVRRKLLPKYHGLSQEELNKIKMGTDGKEIDISHDVEYPLYVFMGDTNERALYTVDASGKLIFNKTLEKFKIIIIECTFLDKEHLSHAKKDRHMHWDKLEPYIRAHMDTRFILIHFSTRYSVDYIEKFFEKVGLDNVVPFIPTTKTAKIPKSVSVSVSVSAPASLSSASLVPASVSAPAVSVSNPKSKNDTTKLGKSKRKLKREAKRQAELAKVKEAEIVKTDKDVTMTTTESKADGTKEAKTEAIISDDIKLDDELDSIDGCCLSDNSSIEHSEHSEHSDGYSTDEVDEESTDKSPKDATGGLSSEVAVIGKVPKDVIGGFPEVAVPTGGIKDPHVVLSTDT